VDRSRGSRGIGRNSRRSLGFRDRPLLGYGPENHKLVWSAHFDPRIYAIDTDVYDRTHNQFLEMLATTGLVGTVAFLGIWFAIALTLVRAYRAGRLSAPALSILAGLQVAYAIYLFFWFVDLNSTMLWILIAALIASRGTVGSVVLEVRGSDTEAATARPALAFASIVVLIAALYSEAWTPLRANRALARLDSPRGNVAQTLSEIELLSNSSARQGAHTPILMAQFIGSLRPRLEEMRASRDERRMLDSAFAESFVTFAREIHRDTLNDRLYLHEGGLLLEAAHFYQSSLYEQLAIDAFHKAIELSPRRIEQRLALASLYTGNRDYERALVVLSDAVKTDPLLGEPRYRLAEAYIGAGHADSALAMLQTSLRLAYVGAPEIYLVIGKRLEFSGRSTTAAKLYSDYLEAKYTEAVWDRSQAIDRPVPTADIAVAAHLPLLYMRASSRAEAPPPRNSTPTISKPSTPKQCGTAHRRSTDPSRRLTLRSPPICHSSTCAHGRVSSRSRRRPPSRRSIRRVPRSSIGSSPMWVRGDAQTGWRKTRSCLVPRPSTPARGMRLRSGRAEYSAESSKRVERPPAAWSRLCVF